MGTIPKFPGNLGISPIFTSQSPFWGWGKGEKNSVFLGGKFPTQIKSQKIFPGNFFLWKSQKFLIFSSFNPKNFPFSPGIFPSEIPKISRFSREFFPSFNPEKFSFFHGFFCHFPPRFFSFLGLLFQGFFILQEFCFSR